MHLKLPENVAERATNRAHNLQQQEASKAWEKAKVEAHERRLAKEARSHERQARRDEKQRLGLDPNTASA